MYDKVEIYPYQRITETVITSRKPSKPKRDKVINLKEHINDYKFDINKNLAWVKGFTLNHMLIAIGALIMARALVLEEILPFIFAYLAVFSRQEKAPTIVVGIFALIGFLTLLSGAALSANLFTLLVLMGVLNYIKIPANQKWWGLPLLVTAVLVVAKTLMALLTEISFYGQMVVVFEAMMAGILTFIFMVVNEVLEQKKPLVSFSFEDMAGFIILGIGLVMGFNDINVGNLSISSIICRLGILIGAFIWGSGGGTIVGVMAGIIPSISSSIFAPTLGMYALSGLLAGLFKHFGRLGVIIGFMLGNLALSMFIPESRVTILGLWETAIAALIFMILPSSLKENIPIKSLGPINEAKDNNVQMLDARLNETARSRMERLAGVFAELSATFTQEKPALNSSGGAAYLNYLYDEIAQNFCECCSRYESCWGRDCYSTSQEILDIFTLAEAHGQVNYEDCLPEFQRRCLNGRDMVKTVNFLFDNLRLNEYWADKLNATKDLVALQLKGIGDIINDLAVDMEVKTTLDLELSHKLLQECKRLGLKDIIDITPIRNGAEHYYLKITANSCASGNLCESNWSLALSSMMKERLKVCDKECPKFKGRGPCEFTLTRAFTYKVNSGAAQKGREDICGDSFTIATLKEGKALIALSDGMGIGEMASSQSQTAVRLLESLLSSGFTREVALKTINSVLMLKTSQDTFATLDMMIMDLYTGEVDFIKIGSAPSFIKRDKQVGIIKPNSIPMGILNEVDLVTQQSYLNPHDLVVMVSDGVLEIFKEADASLWVADFLADLNETDPQIVAEMILNKALSFCTSRPNDDMTVICSYIELNL